MRIILITIGLAIAGLIIFGPVPSLEQALTRTERK